MNAAKDLLKRAVELDSAQRYSEALICYEEGIQNILRAMGECKTEEEKKELRKKAEEYLARAEQLKQQAKDQDVATERVQCVQVKAGEVGHSYDSCLCHLQIWDTAGQERFRTVTQSYYRGAHGVIIAYDITNMDTFSHIPSWVDDIKRYAGPDAVMLLIGTKKDTVALQPRLREVPFNQAKRYAATKHMLDAVETSAKDNTNIECTFMRMARALWRKNEGLNSVTDTEMSFRLSTQLVEEGKVGHVCPSCSVL